MNNKILHHLAMPGESVEYRAARNKLLVEEMALRVNRPRFVSHTPRNVPVQPFGTVLSHNPGEYSPVLD